MNRGFEFGSATWTRTRDPMINSHLLYRLSYRGTAVRILLFIKGKSTRLCSNHLHDGVGDVIHVVVVERRCANATGANGVDAKLDAQALDLCGGQSRIGEHAALLGNEAEVRLGAFL